MSTKLTLPQNDPASRTVKRQSRLKRMRRKYAYTLTYKGHIATINKLPRHEKPGAYYQLKALANLSGLIPSLPGLLWKFLKFNLLGQPFKQYDDFFFFAGSRYPDPEFRENFWNDVYFGRQCVAGTNPVMIEGVNARNPLPNTFKIQQAQLPLSTQTLDEALADDRLYMVDYSMLKPLSENPGVVNGYRKYITAPIALFYLEDNRQLRPLAVQLDVTKATGPDNPIITPAHDQQWQLARTCVLAADGTVHDLWSHAVHIHYVMESIIMVSYRRLGKWHPLLALLLPHLQYTLSVNAHPLYEPDKNGRAPDYGKMFSCNNDTLVAFMGQGMRAFSFRDRAFPNDIKRRHMENPKLDYPYRDNGWRMWDVIQEFVSNYVNVYYENDQDVVNDYELQYWAKELGGNRHDGHCGLNDFPTRLASVSEVAATIGQIIFMATAHHSSIHYPQYQYAGYPPNMPLSLYQPPVVESEQHQLAEGLMGFFPHYKMAFKQAFIYYAVGFKVNRLGEYDLQRYDKPAADVIRKYQQDLKNIASSMKVDQHERNLSYPFMNPDNIPNGVTV